MRRSGEAAVVPLRSVLIRVEPTKSGKDIKETGMEKQISLAGKRGDLRCLLFEPECSASIPHRGSFLFLPGMPGTDRNEDIAADLMRQGFRVLCLSYSGSCGSAGSYSIQHMLEDSETAYRFLRDSDPEGVSILGHSLGGFVCAQTAARHPETRSVVLLFPCDIGRLPVWDWEAFMTAYVVKEFIGSHTGSLVGTHPDTLLTEIYSNADNYSFTQLAPALSRVPVLMIGGTKDYYAPPALNCRPLLESIQRIPDNRVLYQEFDTGHYGAECRGMISYTILRFLGV